MVENTKVVENEYKPRNLWGLVMELGLILALPFFTELIIKIVISDTPLPFCNSAGIYIIMRILHNGITCNGNFYLRYVFSIAF